jgi:hypothetical protein
LSRKGMRASICSGLMGFTSATCSSLSGLSGTNAFSRPQNSLGSVQASI